MKSIILSTTIAVFTSFTVSAKPMNVLFISADDLNCDIGTYGVKQVKTPNLDRLAKMGMRFDRAYCQQPLCGPSRASVMTGLRPNTINVHTLKDELRAHKPNLVTLGEFFKEKGYYSGRVGKIYHYGNPSQIGTDGHDDPQTWTERFNPKGIDKTQEDKITVYKSLKKSGGLGISLAWWDPVSEDDEHTDGKVAAQAVEMINAHKDEPFFIAAGFFNPHCPYVAPKKYFDLYDINKITMPDLAAAKEDLRDVPEMAIKRDKWQWPYYRKADIEEARQCKLAYYASVSFLDAQVGRLLDALEKNDLMNNTIIVLWSDHGYFLGEKGLWFKRKAFERSARAPLLIATPETAQGNSCSTPVELIDLYPTIVDYAGYEIPDCLEGRTLRPLLTNPTASWDKPAITQVYHSHNAQGYSIRNKQWRYTEWNNGDDGKELYNHDVDPEEKTNLAENPEYTTVIAALSKQLKKYSSTYDRVPVVKESKKKNKSKKKKRK